MISVKNLKKSFKSTISQPGTLGFFKNIFNRQYKEKTAVNDISFEIPQGELVGFLGPNGAGKTTTMKMLAGILYPTSGVINVLGFTPFEKKPEYLRQIAFVMGQKNQMLWELPPMDTFRLNKEIYGISDREYKTTIDELSSLLDAKDILTQPVKTLSLGQRMKTELISTLLHKPKVLFLDEPTIGLDVVAQKTMRDFIKEYQARHKATILLTSHYMEDVRTLAKRIIIIDNGEILYDGQLSSLIDSYASDKVVEISVDTIPPINILSKIPFKHKIIDPKIQFRAPRKDIPALVASITQNVSFVDMNIEEEKIEDIVRKIFQKTKVK